MLQKGPWKAHSNGFYLTQTGDIRLLVERVGVKFRVLVTRIIDEMQPEELVYAGSATNADDAMILAEHAAERAHTTHLAA